MISGPIKTQIDSVWNAFWSGGISNPLEVIEQITYLLFLRRLDDLHTLELNKATRLKTAPTRRIFPDGSDSKGRPYEDFRWSRFQHFEAKDLFVLVGEHVFPFLRTLGGDGSTYAKHMEGARFTIPTPALLAKVVDLLDEVPMEDRDTKGDLYAALILFGTHAALGRHLDQCELVFEYRPTDASGPAADRREFREGFFLWQDALWERINLRNDRQSYQDGLFRNELLTFDEASVREALLNAVSHRDYRSGSSIFVRQYPQRLEVVSPGGFPPGVTVDNLLDAQNPRNRRLATALQKCGLIERSGQGMNLMFEHAIRQGKALPDFNGRQRTRFAFPSKGQ